MYEFELTNACYKLLHDMFDLKPGESIAITCDTESNMEVVDATAKAAFALGAKPLVLKMPAPRDCGKAGDADMPIEPLVKAIKGCDAWVNITISGFSIPLLMIRLWKIRKTVPAT